MTRAPEDGERLTPRDEDFVRQVAEGYAAPARSEARQQAFRRALEARLQGAQRGGLGLPALAGVLAMAVAAFVLSSAAPQAPRELPAPALETETVEISFDGSLPEDLFVGTEAVPGTAETLPEDYAAIGGVLLGS